MTSTRLALAFFLLTLGLNSAVSAVHTGLSPHIHPLSYDLTVKVPVLEHFQGFTASVVIHFNLTATTSNITLHSRNLYSLRNISLISSRYSLEPTLKSIRIFKDTVELSFLEELRPGQFLLTIGEYNGRLSNASTGVIQRNLTLFTTHLQPHFARELLPCVDHPSVKAAFRLTVIHPTNTVAESNTIANDVFVVDPQWQKTVFAPTPSLPAYLIAFSVMPDTYKQVCLRPFLFCSRKTTFLYVAAVFCKAN
ncbi:peptidase family M1 [Ancylostoma caninum]|uniref:Peptidase family M1 n=1 Tax=Ancylostoma caninum TaxID=29170 RepID=A0A368GHC1_ANCCA|nr:peptidase family M1 [Ancylostoma caninum]